MLDIERYAELKAKGVLSLVKTPEGVLTASSKHFDATTGEEGEATVESVSVSALQEQRRRLQVQIEQLTLLLADLAALP